MFSQKTSTADKDKGKEPEGDLKIRLDSVEMESVAEQLRAIEAKKAKDKNKK